MLQPFQKFQDPPTCMWPILLPNSSVHVFFLPFYYTEVVYKQDNSFWRAVQDPLWNLSPEKLPQGDPPPRKSGPRVEFPAQKTNPV